ncbi:hypothetical protein [Hyphococcus sp.]|uniref:hypothetical protein n=1 Tax=Hyphococcus sp. TaxID=2038636 RepID=UPI003CCBC321
MSKRIGLALLGGILFSATQAGAEGFKVVGGAERINAGGIEFSMKVSAIPTRGGFKGSIQYSREANGGAAALTVHATADCMWVSTNGERAVVAGTAQIRKGASDQGSWFFAAI